MMKNIPFFQNYIKHKYVSKQKFQRRSKKVDDSSISEFGSFYTLIYIPVLRLYEKCYTTVEIFFIVHLEWSHIALGFRLYTHKEKSLIRTKPLCPKFTNRPISTMKNSFRGQLRSFLGAKIEWLPPQHSEFSVIGRH